jgi:hypothetical protein
VECRAIVDELAHRLNALLLRRVVDRETRDVVDPIAQQSKGRVALLTVQNSPEGDECELVSLGPFEVRPRLVDCGDDLMRVIDEIGRPQRLLGKIPRDTCQREQCDGGRSETEKRDSFERGVPHPKASPFRGTARPLERLGPTNRYH